MDIWPATAVKKKKYVIVKIIHFCTFCLKKKCYRKFNQFLNTLSILVTKNAKFSGFWLSFFLHTICSRLNFGTLAIKIVFNKELVGI